MAGQFESFVPTEVPAPYDPQTDDGFIEAATPVEPDDGFVTDDGFIEVPPTPEEIEQDELALDAQAADIRKFGAESVPNDEAGIYRLSENFGVRPNVIRDIYPDVKKSLETEPDIRKWRKSNPFLFDTIAKSPPIAGLVVQDKTVKRTIEEFKEPGVSKWGGFAAARAGVAGPVTWRTEEKTERGVFQDKTGLGSLGVAADSFMNAAAGNAMAKIGFTQMLLDMKNPESEAAYFNRNRIQQMRVEQGPPSLYGDHGVAELLGQGAGSGLDSSVSMLAGAGVGLVATPAAGVATALTLGVATSFVSETGGAYLDFVDSEPEDENGNKVKMDRDIAMGAAIVYGLAASGVEFASTILEFNAFKGFKEAIVGGGRAAGKAWMKEAVGKISARRILREVGKRMAKVSAEEGLEEGVQQSLQEGAGWAGSSLSAGTLQAFDFSRAAGNVLDSMAVGSVAPLTGIGGMQGLYHGSSTLMKLHQSKKHVAEAQAALGMKDAGGQAAAPWVAKIASAAAADNGKKLTHFYFDPQAIVNEVEKNGGSVDEIAMALMGEKGPERLQRALAERGAGLGESATLEVPAEEFYSNWDKKFAETLYQDVTYEPGRPTDREARQYQVDLEDARKTLLDRDGAIEDDTSPEEAAFAKKLEDDLANTGEMTRDEARTSVLLTRAVIRTLTKRNPEAAREIFGNISMKVGTMDATQPLASAGAVMGAYSQMLNSEVRAVEHFRDRATGAYNLQGAELAPRDPSRPMFALFDMEGFKLVNDEIGHEAGNAALQAMVQTAMAKGIEDSVKSGASVGMFVRDQAHADEIAAAMREAIDPRLGVTHATVSPDITVQKTIEKAAAEHAVLKAKWGSEGVRGHRQLVPAALREEGAPVFALNPGDAGLSLDSEEAQAYRKRAAAKLAPSFEGMKPGKAQAKITEVHRRYQESLNQARAAELAYLDDSGLFNRNGFERAQELNKRRVTVAMDLDGLHAIDEAFGTIDKETGDRAADAIIHTVAEVIREIGGGAIDAARLGGDEFAAQHDNAEYATKIFQRASEYLENTYFALEKGDSVVLLPGVSLTYATGTDLSSADRALGAAKRAKKLAISQARTEADRAAASRGVPVVVSPQDFDERVHAPDGARIHWVELQGAHAARSAEVTRRRRGKLQEARISTISATGREKIHEALSNPKSAATKALANDIAAQSQSKPASRLKFPAKKDDQFAAVMESIGGVDSSPTEYEDSKYRKWRESKKGKGDPAAYAGGQDGLFDAVNSREEFELKGIKANSVRHAFDVLSKNVRTWEGLESVVDIMRRSIKEGMQNLQMPEWYQAEKVARLEEERTRELIEERWADHVEAFDSEDLYQDGPEGERGMVEIISDGVTRQINIFLVRGKSDLSTFIHESAHGYMDIMRSLAGHQRASQQVRNDWRTIVKWVGGKVGEDLTVAQKEKFARGFELYIREGKSPSVGLTGAFYRLSRWLKNVYRNLRSLNVRINPEVRAVFDRMLATDNEIKLMRRQAGLDKRLYRTPAEAGMTADEWNEFVDDQIKASGTAALRARVVARRLELEAAEREKSASYKRHFEQANREWDEQLPVQAWKYLRHGEQRDSEGNPITNKELGKLDREFMLKIFDEDSWAVKAMHGRLTNNMVHPNEVAGQFGYKNAREMFSDIENMQDKGVWVKERADELMEDELPSHDKAIEDLRMEIAKGIHGDYPTKIALKELNALARKVRGKDKRPILAEAIEQEAKKYVQRHSLNQLKLGKVMDLERSAAESATIAMAKGEHRRALHYAQKRLMFQFVWNHMANAVEKKNEFRELGKRMAREPYLRKLGLVDTRFSDVVDKLLGKLGFRKIDETLDLPDLVGVTEELRLAGLEPKYNQNFIHKLLNSAPQPWPSLSVDETDKVYEFLAAIAAAERILSTAKTAMGEVERQEVVQKLVEEIHTSAFLPEEGRKEPASSASLNLFQKGIKYASAFDGYMLKPQTLLDWAGNDSSDSMFWSAILRPLHEAKYTEHDLVQKHTRPVVEAMNNIPEFFRARLGEKIDTSELFPGWRDEEGFPKRPDRLEQILIMALNMGNDGNKYRLLEGFGITESQMLNAMARLPDEALHWVQAVWDAASGMWPLEKALEERERGRAPAEVTPTPLTVVSSNGNSIHLAGGYFPAVYNKDVARSQSVKELGSILALVGDPTTPRGHLKERVADFQDLLSLEPDVVQMHLFKVAHDLAFREVLRSVSGLLLDEEVDNALRAKLGPEKTNQFRVWLADVARIDVGNEKHLGFLAKLLRGVRSNMVTGVLGYAVDIATGDLTNAFTIPLASSVKPKHFAASMADFFDEPEVVLKWAIEKSGEVRIRQEGSREEFARQIKSMRRGKLGRVNAAIRDHAFFAMEHIDQRTSAIAFLSGYRQSLEENPGDEQKAIDEGNRVVQKVMPARHAVDQSALGRDKGFVGSLLVFQTYMNVLYNMDARMRRKLVVAKGFGAKSSEFKKVIGPYLALLFVTRIAEAFLTGKGPRDDDGDSEAERWLRWSLRRMLVAAIVPVPLFGATAEAWAFGLRGVGVRSSPFISQLQTFEKTVPTMVKLATEHDADGFDDKKVWNAVKSVGLLGGFPIRLVGAAEHVAKTVEGNQNIGGVRGFAHGVVFREIMGNPRSPLTLTGE